MSRCEDISNQHSRGREYEGGMLALRDGHWRALAFPVILGPNPAKDSIVGGKDAAGDACHLTTSFNLTTAVFQRLKELIYLLPR